MHGETLRSHLGAVLYWVLCLAVPAWLLLAGVRLLMTELYLRLEYSRADFPVDVYGFSQEDRLEYAPYAVGYLLNAEGIDYLRKLSFPDGSPMYNDRELKHMTDVKTAIQVAMLVYGILSVGLISALLVSLCDMTTRRLCQRILSRGALLTLILVASIAVLAILSWNMFFESFHQLFFEEGTWRFYYSDTLIRLFPEKFWFDAALSIGVIAVSGATLILLGHHLSQRLKVGR